MLEALHMLELIHEMIGALFVILIYIIVAAMPATLLLGAIRIRSIFRAYIVQICITLAILVYIAHLLSEPRHLSNPFISGSYSGMQLAPFVSASLMSVGIGAVFIPTLELIQPFSLVDLKDNVQRSWKRMAVGTTVSLLLLMAMMKAPIWICEYHWEVYCFVWRGSF